MWSDWWDNPDPLTVGADSAAMDDLAAAIVERYEALDGRISIPTPWRIGNGRYLSDDLLTTKEGEPAGPTDWEVARGSYFLDGDGNPVVVQDSGSVTSGAGEWAGAYVPTGRRSQAWRLQGPIRELMAPGGAELFRDGNTWRGGNVGTWSNPAGYDYLVEIKGLKMTLGGHKYRCLDASPEGRKTWRGPGGVQRVFWLGAEPHGSPIWQREDGATVRVWRRRSRYGYWAMALYVAPNGTWFVSKWITDGAVLPAPLGGKLQTMAMTRVLAPAPDRLFCSQAKYRLVNGVRARYGGLFGLVTYARRLQSFGFWVNPGDSIPNGLGQTPLTVDWVADAVLVREALQRLMRGSLSLSEGGGPFTYQLLGSEAYKQVAAYTSSPCRFHVMVNGAEVESSEDFATEWVSTGTYTGGFFDDPLSVEATLQLEYT